MENIVIVVRAGRVESVLTSAPPHQLDVEVLDMDTKDWVEAELLRKRLRAVQKKYGTDLLV